MVAASLRAAIPILTICAASLAVIQCQARTLSSLGIEVRGPSRPFVFTNSIDAFYYGETGGPNTTSWQGFNVRGRELLDDYLLLVKGKPFARTAASRTVVYPDHLERHYPGGIREEVWPADSLALIAVTLTFPTPVDAGIVPLFSDALARDEFAVELSTGLACVARTRDLGRSPATDPPLWLGISAAGALPESLEYRAARQYSPVRLYARNARRHTFLIAAGSEPGRLRTLLDLYQRESTQFRDQRRQRMEAELSRSRFETDNADFNRGLAWAKLSLSALIMNQTGKGIFAGLPWFNSYWGRDTFIALPGATLVTGAWADARDIFRSFSMFQQRDSSSSDFGRIPNIVTLTDTAYNTADGTPRFVMMAREYIERSGDASFLLEMYPVVLRSIEGTLRYHTDSLGFLTHGDAETWMDAVGPDGPWSPRGNRANDIQALWARQLEAGMWFATRLGDVRSARSWHVALNRVRASFTRSFVRDGKVADHLLPDGRPDVRVRPNQVFTAPLLSAHDRRTMLGTVVTQLTYPYGVASLAQTDDGFHPYHEHPPFYPKDAAYHNGTVWTWLQGPVISELCSAGLPDTAFVLTRNAVHQILRRGAVGTQSELLDALARPGEAEPRLSGTVSQAWNLGEFVRNAYDDYLGVRVNALERRIAIRPRLPKALGNVTASVVVGNVSLGIAVASTATPVKITLTAPPLLTPYTLTVELPSGSPASSRSASSSQASFTYGGGKAVVWMLNDSTASVVLEGKRKSIPARRVVSEYLARPIASEAPSRQAASEAPTGELASLRFAVPHLRPGLKSLKGPAHRMLSHAEVVQALPQRAPAVDVSDQSNDDIGVGPVLLRGGRLSYPENPHFRPGSFDLTRFTVHADSSHAVFTLRFHALSDPGWHPEYGFQLTMVAIAIDTDGKSRSGRRTLPAQSLYAMPGERGYERLILVGGGIRVEDAAGITLAGYTPTEPDAADPIGNSMTGTIRFSIPLSVLGTPTSEWTYVVVAGAQDDHGGAGIGEFRAVHAEHGEWNGGGKLHTEEPNIYDELIAP